MSALTFQESYRPTHIAPEAGNDGSYRVSDGGNDLLPRWRRRRHHSGVCIRTLQNAVEAALADTSKGDPIFRFARAIKSFELTIDARLPKNELSAAFNLWWIKASPDLPPDTVREECLYLFLDAYTKARTPLGSNVIENALLKVDSTQPPTEANRYISQKIQRLIHLCYALQTIVGETSFFLASQRDAARALGLSTKSQSMIGAFLRGLERDGILRVTERGKGRRQKRLLTIPLHQTEPTMNDDPQLPFIPSAISCRFCYKLHGLESLVFSRLRNLFSSPDIRRFSVVALSMYQTQILNVTPNSHG